MQSGDTVYCETTLNYAGAVDHEPVTTVVYDGRALLDRLEFEECGFTLLDHESRVRDWTDEEELRAVHVPEIERLVTQFMGCDRAIVYPPIVRSPGSAARVEDYAPILSVHSDFTEDYGRMVREPGRPYRAFLDPLLHEAGLELDDLVGADRIALIQFWRNVGPQYPDYPFALCDAGTVPRSQLIPILVPEYGGIRLEFEAFAVRTPESAEDNTWYTFPGLSPNEVIVLRTYDSRCEAEGQPFWTPHTAFADPVAGPDAPHRESVEMRALCLFGV